MKIIGITGSSGAGKSTICGIIRKKYNSEIIDADKVAKQLTKKGSLYLNAIVEYFGKEIIDNNGELIRKKLGDIIYNNNEKRENLNELTFIYVVDEIKNKIAQIKNKDYIVIDAPLLYESGLDSICDFVIAVIADRNKQLKRITKRDAITEDIAQKRLDIQNTNEFFMKKSQKIINNNTTIEALEKEIEKILEELE